MDRFGRDGADPDVVSASAPRRHHRPHSPLRSSLELGLAWAVLGALRALPLERAGVLAAGASGSAARWAARLRRTGLDNLAHAFPERSAEWREATLRGSLRSLGLLAAEIAHLGEMDEAWLRARIGFADDEARRRWEDCIAGGGGIIATAHFGNWELFAHAQGILGRPVHLVHRPLRNPLVDDLVRTVRQRAGTGVIYKHAAAREILRRLRDGALVAIPIDQHAPGAEGVPIPFFGRPAATTLGPARLAQIARVPIQFAVLVREGESHRHRIWMGPRHSPPPGRDPTLLVAAVRQVVMELEQVVRAHPEQWLWVHRRWRVSPG